MKTNLRNEHEINQVRNLAGSAYVIRFSRNGMEFVPGQYLLLGLPGATRMGEYSIYSGLRDEYLEVLIREMNDGVLSRQLKKIRPGDLLKVQGPYGSFLKNAPEEDQGKRVFISSGTGIAPFHSFARSYPGKDFRLIHGIRTLEEAYDREDYHERQLFICTSRDRRGDFHGRLTDYLTEARLDPGQHFFLCGGSGMIRDATDILRAAGVPRERIFTAIYF
ncbi:MAG: FAD-dependent oxidoreductase [Bacteroidales bacterium]